jgi:pimeloyl-ACP methyl ester carboxylesterase
MHILVNGVRLFVDVANAGLVPDGDRMREKPALLMLHGGPGFDHVLFKDAFSVLSDVAQVIFYDHRGNGRSEGNDPSTWNPVGRRRERALRRARGRQADRLRPVVRWLCSAVLCDAIPGASGQADPAEHGCQDRRRSSPHWINRR